MDKVSGGCKIIQPNWAKSVSFMHFCSFRHASETLHYGFKHALNMLPGSFPDAFFMLGLFF
jgi:hypothetical protein